MSETAQELRAAWDELIAQLERARDAIDDPALMPPPPTDRLLAEGYRYLLGFTHSAFERAFFEDPKRPIVHNALSIFNKATIENADAIYFAAAIDGRESYVLRGQAADFRHWKGAVPAPEGPIAPQYLIFEVTHGVLAGDTGSLAELRPGTKATMGRIDTSDLVVEPDGGFEILLAPERPDGHTGNFIRTRRRTSRPAPDDPEGRLERHADYVSGRQLFYDWAREEPIHLQLARVGEAEERPPAYGPGQAAREMRRMGSLVRGQMHFWNAFYTELLEVHGKRPGRDGPRFMPRNAFNPVNAASGATGGGQSTNLYAGGIFELGPDEALIVETRVPVPAQYTGFHLANLWGESIDYANRHSSLNGFQSETDADGATRYVVAHRDPGVPNWLDTAGHREGFLTPRWAYSETPDEKDWPTISARVVPFDQIRRHLPAETRTVTPEERNERIRIRQQHVKRRYRVF